MSDSTSRASAEFWLGLQSDYELEKAKDELAARIEREVHPRKRAAGRAPAAVPFSASGN
ncbi:hypothetical protein [Candidatus Binatus soli]|jgi:plasmid maintenance system antidote protein VapI|uniref:hypothetical protein n=1 Tax=Candidatus Binatus soli TaxID=1953413 RepID=UPI003D0ECEF1